MSIVIQILFNLILLALIVLITSLHASLFNDNRPIEKGFHATWAAIYSFPVLVVGSIYLFTDGWKVAAWFLICALLERIAFYDWILNRLRGKKFFYVSVSNPIDPSFFDKFKGAAWPFIWAAITIFYIVFQFIRL